MPKYINVDNLLKKLDYAGAICDFGRYIIIREPAADVVPVNHGQWIDEDDTAVCSVCGERQGNTDIQLPYCPWCGAKMDGKL